MTEQQAPYANPGRCEGTSKNPKNVLGRTDYHHGTMRCQRPAVVWNEKRYAWLCEVHDRAAKR